MVKHGETPLLTRPNGQTHQQAKVVVGPVVNTVTNHPKDVERNAEAMVFLILIALVKKQRRKLQSEGDHARNKSWYGGKKGKSKGKGKNKRDDTWNT